MRKNSVPFQGLHEMWPQQKGDKDQEPFLLL